MPSMATIPTYILSFWIVADSAIPFKKVAISGFSPSVPGRAK